MKTKTGGIPMWQHKCDCSEVDELEAALEVLVRQLAINGPCPPIGDRGACGIPPLFQSDNECSKCWGKYAFKRARKNLKRRKK